MLCFTLYLRAIFKHKPRGGGGGLIFGGEILITEGFLRYELGGLIFGGAYTRRGLFSEFYGVLRYLPIRCHFLHFEITVNGNTAPKIIAGPWSDAKRVKMAEKSQKEK